MNLVNLGLISFLWEMELLLQWRNKKDDEGGMRDALGRILTHKG